MISEKQKKMARYKKGSKEAKAWGRRMARLRSAPTRKRKKRNSATKYIRKTMVKRRYTKKAKRRTTKKSFSMLGINSGKAISAMMYGAMRSKTSNMISPYTAKLPLGNISDEVGMIGTTFLLKKYLFKKAGILRDALNSGQTIELARIGEAVANGDVGIPFLNGNVSSGATSTNGNIF